jgi:hypothetical protein
LITHFNELAKGVIGAATAVYLATLVGVCLLVNTLIVDLEKAR